VSSRKSIPRRSQLRLRASKSKSISRARLSAAVNQTKRSASQIEESSDVEMNEPSITEEERQETKVVLSDEILYQIFGELFEYAQQHDKNGNLAYATHLYLDGIRIMILNKPNLETIKSKHLFYADLHAFEKRAYQINEHLDVIFREREEYEEISLLAGMVGYNYNSVFKRYIKRGPVSEVLIYENDLSSLLKVKRMIGFFRYLFKACPELQFVYVDTHSNLAEGAKVLIFQLFDNAEKAIKLETNNPDRKCIIMNNGYMFESPVGVEFFEDEHEFCDFEKSLDHLPCRGVDVKIFRFQPYSRKLKPF